MPAKARSLRARKSPSQTRSRATVDCIVEAAARVFRREGFRATTNRIAKEAGVSIGSLYEYFPNKQALLVELAMRHVELAERELAGALAHEGTTPARLGAIRAAILASQRFPSHALAFVTDVRAGPELAARATALRARTLAHMTSHARALGRSEPELRAQAALRAIGDLSARAMFEEPAQCEALGRHYLAMACALFDRE